MFVLLCMHPLFIWCLRDGVFLFRDLVLVMVLGIGGECLLRQL
jgi:hypothetical protein